MRTLFTTILVLMISLAHSQSTPAEIFWEELKSHCGKSYEGKVLNAPENDQFRDHRLLMHVRACEDGKIRIPFFVGEDRSRTWVLTWKEGTIELKHDHRLEDGSDDEVTMYGGTASNTGLETIQVFPADPFTADLIPAAATNVWWITLDKETFTYNLKRIGTDRVFTVAFDLNNTVSTPDAPWGWED